MASNKSFGQRQNRTISETGKKARKGGHAKFAIIAASLLVVGTGAMIALQMQSQPPSQIISTAEATTIADDVGIGAMWVATDRADLRSCMAESCGLSNQVFFRQQLEVIEINGGWGRVSPYIEAPCSNGQTSYLQVNAACIESNGFIDGRYAEWVNLALLTSD